MKKLRVIVVDADPLARMAIARAVDAAADLVVAGQAGDGPAALALVASQRPDVLVMDARLGPAEDGLAVLRAIHREHPQLALMVLSSIEDDDLAFAALRAGACGFLGKGVSIEALPRIVRAVARGEAVLTRALTTKLVKRLRELPESGAGLRPVRSDLSSREWEVLDLICTGASTRQIAGDLGLSTETVRSHVKRILRKLDAHSRAEAVERARALLSDSAT